MESLRPSDESITGLTIDNSVAESTTRLENIVAVALPMRELPHLEISQPHVLVSGQKLEGQLPTEELLSEEDMENIHNEFAEIICDKSNRVVLAGIEAASLDLMPAACACQVGSAYRILSSQR